MRVRYVQILAIPLVQMLSIIRSSSSSSPFLRKGPFSRIQRLLINAETSRATGSQTQKLELIADELINLTRLEQYDYAILFRHKLGFQNYGPLISGIRSPTASADASGTGMVDAKPSAKTTFDIKLEKFDGSAKIKIIKEVRTFTDLGLKEAKDLVEKAPIVIKKGLSKEEVDPILEKLKELGATVILE